MPQKFLFCILTDCVFEVETPTDAEMVCALYFAVAKTGPLSGILGVEERPRVSSDYLNDTWSSIIDLPSTMVTDGTMIKINAWHDSERGMPIR